MFHITLLLQICFPLYYLTEFVEPLHRSWQAPAALDWIMDFAAPASKVFQHGPENKHLGLFNAVYSVFLLKIIKSSL